MNTNNHPQTAAFPAEVSAGGYWRSWKTLIFWQLFQGTDVCVEIDERCLRHHPDPRLAPPRTARHPNASRSAPARPLHCSQSAFSTHASAHAAQSFAFAICRTVLCRRSLLTYLIMDQTGHFWWYRRVKRSGRTHHYFLEQWRRHIEVALKFKLWIHTIEIISNPSNPSVSFTRPEMAPSICSSRHREPAGIHFTGTRKWRGPGRSGRWQKRTITCCSASESYILDIAAAIRADLLRPSTPINRMTYGE